MFCKSTSLVMPKKGSVLRVNIGWACIVVAGVGAFILARNSIVDQRKETIRKQKAIVDQMRKEVDDQNK